MQPHPPGKKSSIDDQYDGSPSSYRRAYELYYRLMYLFAFNILRDEPEAEDIAQESLIKLWRLQANFDSFSKIRSFLYITTRNASLDLLKKNSTREKANTGLAYLLDHTDQTDPLLADAAFEVELRRQINALPPTCRAVFSLLYFEKLTTTQAAKRLGISILSARQHKRNALQAIRPAILKKNLKA